MQSNSAQGGGGLLEQGYNLAKGVFEHMIDGATFAATSLASSFANGVRYGYKDMTTKTLRGPTLTVLSLKPRK